MERRSPPQKRIDDQAFPVCVKMLVPERGFENLLLDMTDGLEHRGGARQLRRAWRENGYLTDTTACYKAAVTANGGAGQWFHQVNEHSAAAAQCPAFGPALRDASRVSRRGRSATGHTRTRSWNGDRGGED